MYQSLLLRWSNLIHWRASDCQYGNEVVRDAAARSIALNVELMRKGKGMHL